MMGNHYEYQSLENINMQGILDKYVDLIDTFELVTEYCPWKECTDENPYGVYKVSSEDGKRAIEILEKHFKDYHLKNYNQIPEEIKKNLPDFQALYYEIEAETKKHASKTEDELKESNESPFLCDEVGNGKTKYNNPKKFFWGMYHDMGFLLDCSKRIEALMKNSIVRPLDFELNNDKNSALKPYLISITPTFTWHCTTSSCFSKVFRFKLTDEAKKWLLQFETDYDVEGFEDLALYNGDKLLFSSCTHEGFHFDVINK